MLHRLPVRRPSLLAALGVLVGGLLHGRPAQAFSPFLEVPEAEVAEQSPAYRYANMSNEEALAELDRRQILYSRVDPVPGVRAPIRLTGRLHGVWIHSALPPEQRADSIFEILDARLALALDDYAELLSRHDIDEVVHYTMYRPNVPRPEDHGHDAAVAHAPSRPAQHAHAAARGAGGAVHGRSRASSAPAAAASGKAVSKAEPAPKLPAAPAGDLGKGTLGAKKGEHAPAGLKQKAPEAAPPKMHEMVTAPAPAKPRTPGKAVAVPLKHAPLAPSRLAANKPIAKVAAPAAPAPAPAAAPAPASASPRTTWAPPGTRHPAGLAIDVGLLHRRDGTWLNVASHFHGHIGDRTCGEGVAVPASPEAREMRALVCEAQGLGIFTYVLTPNYNAAHADHYHMEIKPGVKWFLYH